MTKVKKKKEGGTLFSAWKIALMLLKGVGGKNTNTKKNNLTKK